MSVFTVQRLATPEETAAEMDRRGAVIEQLETNLRHWREECGKVHSKADNLAARLTSRAKTMLRLRDALAEVHDNIEDEGDRVYFGSTNDADQLRRVWQELDAWNWDDIMADGALPDVYEASRRAHASESRLKDGCNALLGLLQLVAARSDCPPEIMEALTISHRIDEARAALSQATGKE